MWHPCTLESKKSYIQKKNYSLVAHEDSFNTGIHASKVAILHDESILVIFTDAIK